MLTDKKNYEEQHKTENEEINNSIREIDSQQNNPNNIPRGFNVFLSYGISPQELRTLRMLYHLSILHNSIFNNRNIDWSAQAMYQREENWLRAQMNRNLQNSLRNRNAIILRNPRNNSITLYVSHGYGNRFARRRFVRNHSYEPNANFLQGFMFGFILNIFSLCILMISRPSIKFRIGLIFGMLLSCCVTLPFLLSPQTKYL